MKEVPWQIYLPKGLLFIIRRATRTRKAKLSECSLNREDDSSIFFEEQCEREKLVFRVVIYTHIHKLA